jgi:hypothetical protein
MSTRIENVSLSTDQLAAFLGVAVPTLKAWRQAGLSTHLSEGRGRPAAYRLREILQAWLCGQLVRMGGRLNDAARAASHNDFFGPFSRVETDDEARLEVFFRDGRPSLSHDPLTDPTLLIPLGPVFHAVIPALGAELAADHGEDVGQAAEAEFWEIISHKRRLYQLQRAAAAAIVEAIKNE